MLLVILQSSLDWVKYLVSRYASIDSNQNCQGTNKVPSIFNFILYGNPTKQNVGIDSLYSTIHRYICTHIRMCRYINQLLNGISAAAAFSQLECRERRRQKANHWKMLPILLKLAVFAQIKLITNSDANWKRRQRESRAGEWEHRMLQQRTRRLTWTHISLHVCVVVLVCVCICGNRFVTAAPSWRCQSGSTQKAPTNAENSCRSFANVEKQVNFFRLSVEWSEVPE